MTWTVSHLKDRLGISDEEAADVIAIVRGNIDPLNDDRFPKTQQWVQQCYRCHRPHTVELKMEASNELLCGCGVEAVEHEDIWVDRYHGNIVGTYVNFGDTYIPTVIYDTRRGVFTINSWGDFYEALKPDSDEEE